MCHYVANQQSIWITLHFMRMGIGIRIAMKAIVDMHTRSLILGWNVMSISACTHPCLGLNTPLEEPKGDYYLTFLALSKSFMQPSYWLYKFSLSLFHYSLVVLQFLVSLSNLLWHLYTQLELYYASSNIVCRSHFHGLMMHCSNQQACCHVV